MAFFLKFWADTAFSRYYLKSKAQNYPSSRNIETYKTSLFFSCGDTSNDDYDIQYQSEDEVIKNFMKFQKISSHRILLPSFNIIFNT